MHRHDDLRQAAFALRHDSVCSPAPRRRGCRFRGRYRRNPPKPRSSGQRSPRPRKCSAEVQSQSPGPRPRASAGEVQGRGRAVDGHRCAAPQTSASSVLERGNFRALRDEFAAQHVADRLDILVSDVLTAVGDHLSAPALKLRISSTVRKWPFDPELYSKPRWTKEPASPSRLVS